jgi:NTE family protein
MDMPPAVHTPKASNLALQGGGAHGAFTWGVLDALLEDGRIAIPAISGSSAGAINAVVLAEGFVAGGAEGAREHLERFWRSVSEEGGLSSVQARLFTWFSALGLGAPAKFWIDAMTHYASPYEFNPLNLNPLRDHLARMVDFEKLRASDDLKLFVAATNVRTGKGRIFTRGELTADHLMASACLPTLFQAVEIDGEPYWDGGYVGNPPLWPLFYDNACADTIIVQVNRSSANRRPKPRPRSRIASTKSPSTEPCSASFAPSISSSASSTRARFSARDISAPTFIASTEPTH